MRKLTAFGGDVVFADVKLMLERPRSVEAEPVDLRNHCKVSI